jgi:hypothetical protein
MINIPTSSFEEDELVGVEATSASTGVAVN